MKKTIVNCALFLALFLLVSVNLHAQSELGNFPFRIDSHIHLYDTNREGSSTFLNPEKHEKIYFPHLPPEFLKTAVPAGVYYAIVVEASYRREDNEWAMGIVNESENMLAFIANLDPRDANYIPDLELLSKNNKFRGIRIRTKDKIDISDPIIIEKLGELAKRNLVLELGPGQEPIDAIEKIAKKYPKMNIIMNHMAGGRIQDGQIEPSNWSERLGRLAALPNVYCKISALHTLSGKTPAPIKTSFYKPFIDKVVDSFGPDRVLFGSNWTLSEMYGSYSDLVSMYNKYVEESNSITSEGLYFENILNAYGLANNFKNDK